jgi:N6-adenosine-specific RNA methylase IME4
MNVFSEFKGKKFDVIYADPAWEFNSSKTGGSMNSGASQKYEVMSIEELKALPVESLASDNCLLVMWWVGAMPQEAIDLVRAWGFKLKNMNGFVWNKLTVKGNPAFGMGYYTRAGSESAIIATKGKPDIKNRSVRAVISAPVGKHSEKPDEFRKAINKLMGDNCPKIELFARQKAGGFESWGNEL